MLRGISKRQLELSCSLLLLVAVLASSIMHTTHCIKFITPLPLVV